MKLRLSTLFASVMMATTMATAQQTASSDTVNQRMARQLLTDCSVKTTAPLADKAYLPFGREYVSMLQGDASRTEGFTTTNGTARCVDFNNIKPDISHCYVVSKGVTGSPDEVGMVYYAYFSKSQLQVVKYNTLSKQIMKKSDVRDYNDGIVRDFTNTIFLKYLRDNSSSSFDIINAWVANDTRRNEIFQSFVDLNTMDYNADGTDDVFLMAGTTLYVFDGNSLSLLAERKWCNATMISPSSVVYDFNGDGINDYLALHIWNPWTDTGDKNSVEGGILLSERDSQGRVSFRYVQKVMDSHDIASYKNINQTLRSTMTMRIVYPDGRYAAPKLAFAVSSLAYGGCYGSQLNGKQHMVHRFYQQLTLVDFASSEMSVAGKGWYTAAAHINDSALCRNEAYCGSFRIYDRRRPYLFGRPAMNAAFSQGYANAQRIMWFDRILTYNSSAKTFATEFSIADMHNKIYGRTGTTRFDRIVGGQVEVITGSAAQEARLGIESFAMAVAESKDRTDKGTFNDDLDWEDCNYYMVHLFPCQLCTGTVMYPSSHTANNWCYGTGIMPKCNDASPMTITKTSADRGMQVELVDKKTIVSTPIISHVVSAAPYQTDNVSSYGNTSVGINQSQGENHTVSTSNSFGGYADLGADIAGVLKITTRHSTSQSWSSSKGTGISMSSGQTLSNSNGQDFVVFTYFPADRYTYRVVDCPADSTMVGSEFCLVKAQGNDIRQGGYPVDKFNALVAGSACPQITPAVLRHTAGSISSYPTGVDDTDSIMHSFGINDSTCLGISAVMSYLTADLNSAVSLSYSNSTSASNGESFTFSNQLSFTLSVKPWKYFGLNGGGGITKGETSGWTQSTSYSKSYSVGCTMPKPEDADKDRCEFRMVWYRQTVGSEADNTKQSFMVVNYYVTGYVHNDGSQQARAHAFVDAFDDATGISGTTTAKTVDSVKYFDLSGREIAAGTKGLCVKVTTYSDGTRQSAKMMVR